MTKFLLVTGVLLSLTVACSQTYVPRTTAGMRCADTCETQLSACRESTDDRGLCARTRNQCWASCPGAKTY